MPIEIEEVVIRAKINTEKNDPESKGISELEKIQLVQSCVSEVLRAIEAKKRP